MDVRGQNFNLGDLIGLQLHLHVDDVAEVVETANKELKIENKLLNIEEAWTGMTLEYVQHKDQEGMFVVKPPDIVVESLEAHQLELQTMIGMGKFVDFFHYFWFQLSYLDSFQRALLQPVNHKYMLYRSHLMVFPRVLDFRTLIHNNIQACFSGFFCSFFIYYS